MSRHTGAQRIANLFARTRREGRAALMPYLTLGYPSPARSLALVEAAIAGGADLLELGVPFSDPLADGPVIQNATHLALQRGTTVVRCLELVSQVRERPLAQRRQVPLVLMGYCNPILAYGEALFCRDCREAGVDGLIVPDLPPEEGELLEALCRARGLALIYMLAPTSDAARVQQVCQRAQGFVYLVSVAGITGARDRLPPDLAAFVSRVRAATSLPLAVGFGISTPEQASGVAALADGVIVGSALVRLAEQPDGPQALRAAVERLRGAVGRGPVNE
jgi:tryptophan synthase alpha chain